MGVAKGVLWRAIRRNIQQRITFELSIRPKPNAVLAKALLETWSWTKRNSVYQMLVGMTCSSPCVFRDESMRMLPVTRSCRWRYCLRSTASSTHTPGLQQGRIDAVAFATAIDLKTFNSSLPS